MVASYPKSGNTWVRHIISSMINKNYKSLQEYTPSMHTKDLAQEFQLSWNGKDCSIIKTHHYRQHPNLHDIDIQGSIYIVRNPMDVLLSSLNFLFLEKKEKAFKDNQLKTVEQIVSDGELAYYIEQFIEADGVPFYMGMTGKYSANIASWIKEDSNLNLIYEEMIRAPEKAYHQIARFLGFDLDDQHISSLVDIVERKTELNNRFFWKKTAGNFKNYFSEYQIAQFKEAYSDHPSFEKS